MLYCFIYMLWPRNYVALASGYGYVETDTCWRRALEKSMGKWIGCYIMKASLNLLLKMYNNLFLQSKQVLYYAKWKTSDFSMYFSKIFFIFAFIVLKFNFAPLTARSTLE